ncbi:hypothetical protein LAZ67_11003262 [Cordylochernes scorpioides]|uniref:Uncharacterized protein n=1 Tax=Cordylochernes scorpioides TaxID=51811 RepID=A0ABY6L4L2_9ARAC|nr:hypothetical protein LAZ67_11003262 [Cordylochernes scorpioides]
MIFRNGGKSARSGKWYWDQQIINSTQKHLYLGYPLTKSISFTQTALHFMGKAIAALGAVWEILMKSKLNYFHSTMKLLDTIVITTLLYTYPIWSDEQELILNKIQDTFLRRYLNLPNYTPGYILRIETGRTSLAVIAKKYSINPEDIGLTEDELLERLKPCVEPFRGEKEIGRRFSGEYHVMLRTDNKGPIFQAYNNNRKIGKEWTSGIGFTMEISTTKPPYVGLFGC